MGPMRRTSLLVAGFLAAMIGTALVVEPFRPAGDEWRWNLRNATDLEGAEVNARQEAVDADGLLLTRRGARPISLVTPPLALPRDVGSVFVVRAYTLRVTLDVAEPTPIRLFWQTEPGQAFHFVERLTFLTGEPTDVVFSLPVSPEEIRRLGVQFPALDGPVRITSLSLPRLSISERLKAFVRQAVEPEPLANHSVNFLRGPLPLGRPLNQYLLGASLAAVGACLFRAALRGVRPSVRAVACGVLTVWIIGDAVMTQGLARIVFREVRAFRGCPEEDRVAMAHGSAVAHCVAAAEEYVPVGSTYAVISADSFYPARRVDYLLAPSRTCVEEVAHARFILLLDAPGVEFDADEGLLRLGDQPTLPVRLVRQGDSGVQVMENLAAPTANGAPSSPTVTNGNGAQPPSAVSLSNAWPLSALLLPWAVGCFIVRIVSPSLGRMMTIGGGYLIGQAVVMLAMYVDLRWTGGAHPRFILAILVVACVVLFVRLQRSGRHSLSMPKLSTDATSFRPSRTGISLSSAVIALLLAVKLAVMFAAVAFVPIRGDDAVTVWLYRAKVMTSLEAMPLDPDDPYYLGGFIPSYPVPLSLMAAWIPMVTGGWDETLAVAAWPLLYLSLFLVLAGGLRGWLGAAGALVAAYVAASLPLLSIHVIRPGYADLPLAAFLAAAVILLLTWRETRAPGAFAIGLLFAVSAACLKREGPPLAGTIVLVFLATGMNAWRSASAGARRVLSAAIIAALGICLLVSDFGEPVASLSPLGWQTGVLAALGRHVFAFGSFLVLGWLVAAGLLGTAVWTGSRHRVAVLLLGTALIGFVAGVFVLTPQGRFALNDQTPSRLMLQIAPSLIALLGAAFSAALGRTELPHVFETGTNREKC